MTGNLTEDLRAYSDDALAAALARRPDLLTPPPTDVSALAARAQSRVSVARALEGLDLFTLEILDAARLSRDPDDGDTTSVESILSWTAPADGRAVRAALRRLEDLLIVYGRPDELHVVAAVDEICSPYPAGLGRPAALLSQEAAKLADDAAGLRRALLAATPASRAILDRLADGPPIGTVAPSAIGDPDSAVGALVSRSLLVAISDDTVELPREVAFALRRDGRLGELHVTPPIPAGTTRKIATIDSAGTGQVMEAVRQTENLLMALSDEPAGILRTGGLGVRDLRRLARAADVTESLAAVLIEVAAAAGLLGESDPGSRLPSGEPRILPTLAYDQWGGASLASQWSRLARAWLAMDRQPGLINRRMPAVPAGRKPAAADRPASVLGPDLERTGAPRLRAAVLGVLAELEPGATPSIDEILAALHWRAPRRSPWQPGNPDSAATEPVRWTLDEAAQLGLTGFGGLTTYGRLLLDEVIAAASSDAEDDPLGIWSGEISSPAIAALDKLLPAPVDHILIQADLSVIVPGPPEPGLAAELTLVAEPESAGGASVYRVTPERIRSALDSGYSAAELQKLFTRRSRTGVPQALSYLIDDTARRHGGLRLGAAGCYLRSDDVALLAEILADKRLVDLTLRPLAPTVLVTPFLVGRALESLRGAGYAPVQEDAGGAVVVGKVRAFRAPPRRTAAIGSGFGDGVRGLTSARLAAVVEALRQGDKAARAAQRAPMTVRAPAGGATAVQAHTQAMAVLQQAIRDRLRVWVGYVDAHGATASRLLRPVSIGAGYLRAEDERTEMLHTLALHRITAAVVDS
jgi:hypothetical protein